MALYRLRRGPNGNESPYVVTNPPDDTIISHRDKAFVLGFKIPKDLQGDRYEMKEKKGNLPLNLNSQGSSMTGPRLASTEDYGSSVGRNERQSSLNLVADNYTGRGDFN